MVWLGIGEGELKLIKLNNILLCFVVMGSANIVS
jgi:hypothetical protein